MQGGKNEGPQEANQTVKQAPSTTTASNLGPSTSEESKDGKKKRNKKKTKMTDIDLMNNFMKSLHSHPEEDLPIVTPPPKS